MATKPKPKHKVKRYNGEFGSDVDAANEADDPIAALNKSRNWTDTEDKTDIAPAAAPAKSMSFKEAFASARKGGDKTFEWQGKKYTTELAKPKAAAPAPKAEAPKPKYETPYDRMNRQNREAAATRKSTADAERATLRENVRKGSSGAVNAKTLLPMKKGGMTASKRADGIAIRGKTRA